MYLPMDKMCMESPDITLTNIEKISAIFPNCITETIDADGTLKKAINFDTLRQMLSLDVVEGDEAYEFNWGDQKANISMWASFQGAGSRYQSEGDLT